MVAPGLAPEPARAESARSIAVYCEITNGCNLHCRMCSVDAGPGKSDRLDLDDIGRVCDYLDAVGGGRREFRRVIRRVRCGGRAGTIGGGYQCASCSSTRRSTPESVRTTDSGNLSGLAILRPGYGTPATQTSM
jgi:hypothetical protein